MKFQGIVQGVGFRYTALHTAKRLGLIGWVKNMSDGSVEAEAEGEEGQIKAFVESLQEQFGGYIKNVKIDWSESSGGFTAFNVRF